MSETRKKSAFTVKAGGSKEAIIEVLSWGAEPLA